MPRNDDIEPTLAKLYDVLESGDYDLDTKGDLYDLHYSAVYKLAKPFVDFYEREYHVARAHDNWGACRGHCTGTVHVSGHHTADDCDRWDNRAGATPDG